MKKILLIAFLMSCITSLVKAALGDTDLTNKLHFFPNEPVRVEMLDDEPALATRMLIYHTWGAYYFEVVSADTVICEGVWADNNSVEPPESVFNRCKALYGEDQEWYFSEPNQFWFRTDDKFGIWFESKEKAGKNGERTIWAWTLVGGQVTFDTVHHAWREAGAFIKANKPLNH